MMMTRVCFQGFSTVSPINLNLWIISNHMGAVLMCISKQIAVWLCHSTEAVFQGKVHWSLSPEGWPSQRFFFYHKHWVKVSCRCFRLTWDYVNWRPWAKCVCGRRGSSVVATTNVENRKRRCSCPLTCLFIQVFSVQNIPDTCLGSCLIKRV